MKLSIIIPIYNSEKYLRDCLESIACQTLKDIQVVMIDDGSSDSSGSICKEYVSKNKGFEYYYKENGGTASARNLGLEKAQGDYIGFVDSDDYVDSNMFELMYKKALENDADIVYNRMNQLADYVSLPTGVYDSKRITDEIFPQILPHIVSSGTFRTVDWGNWARIFKRTLINENKIKFFDKSRRCEDFAFCVECTLHSKTYVVLNEGDLYHYRPNENSKSRSYSKKMWRSIRSLMLYMKRFTSEYREFDFSLMVDYCVFYFCVNVARNEIRCNDKNLLLKNMSEMLNDSVCRNSLNNISPDKMNDEYRNIYLLMQDKNAKGLIKYLKKRNFLKSRIFPITTSILNNRFIKSVYMKIRRR